MADCNSIESLLNQLINEVNALKAKQPEGDWFSKVLELINSLKNLIVDSINAAVSPLKTAIEAVRQAIADAVSELMRLLGIESQERQSADSGLVDRLSQLESRVSENETKVEEVRVKLEDLGVVLTAATGAIVSLRSKVSDHETRIERIEAELIGVDGKVVQAIEAVKERAISAIDNTKGAALFAIGGAGTLATGAIVAAGGTAAAAITGAGFTAAGAIGVASAGATAAIAGGATIATGAITTTAGIAASSMKAIELALVIAATSAISAALGAAIASLEPKIINVPQPYPVTTIVPYEIPVTNTVYIDRPFPVTVSTPYLVEKPVPFPVPQPYPVTELVPYEIPVTNTVYLDKPVLVPVPTPYPVTTIVPYEIPVTNTVYLDKPVLVSVPTPYPVTTIVPYEKPVIVTQTETQVIEKPVVITQTETRVEVEIREIEKEKTITKLPTCEELQDLQDCLPEKTVTRLPTCEELQELEDCWPTDKVRLPYVTFPPTADEPKTICIEFKALKKDIPTIPTQKFIDSADIAMEAIHKPVAAPEWFEVRVGSGRPQAVVNFREIAPQSLCLGVKKKYGKGSWSLTIPHYNKPKGFKPQIPDYQKGDFEGVLTLKDNSKLVVNCISAAECKRVINALKAYIAPQMLPDKGGLKVGERNGAYKRVKVQATRLKFYHAGQKEFDPSRDFVVRLV